MIGLTNRLNKTLKRSASAKQGRLRSLPEQEPLLCLLCLWASVIAVLCPSLMQA